MTAEPSAHAVLVTTTVGSEDVGAELARILVVERLAACVHLSSPITSTYVWQGSLETSREWVLQSKTTTERLPALMARLQGLHPYEVPEIVATPVVAVDPAYLAWLVEQTSPPPAS